MKRWIYLIAGWLCVSLALAGAVLPLLPCTPFVLLAAACFARSSTQAMNRLRRWPVLGAVLRDWQRHRGMRPAAKFAALCLAIGAPVVTFTLYRQLSLPFYGSVVGGLVAMIVVCRLPTVRKRSEIVPEMAPKDKNSKSEKLPLAA